MPQGEYLGMTLTVLDLDQENLAYFQHCADHDFHLQRCVDPDCDLLRYPPGTACPWCSSREMELGPRRRARHGSFLRRGPPRDSSPPFRERAPYMILLVELDTQAGEPTEHEALRVAGNLVDADGNFAGPELVKQVGIGSRMRMVFSDVSEGLSLAAMDARRRGRTARDALALPAGSRRRLETDPGDGRTRHPAIPGQGRPRHRRRVGDGR